MVEVIFHHKYNMMSNQLPNGQIPFEKRWGSGESPDDVELIRQN